MIESIDQLRAGEYLMCARGPVVTGTDQRGYFVSKPDRSFEGSVVQVLAISPPMILVRVYPMPCGDPSHDHTPYVTTVQFDRMGWTRPPRRYVREYMKAAHHPRPQPTPRLLVQGSINGEKFNAMLEDIYRSGANPDGMLERDDDDDDLSPTDGR